MPLACAKDYSRPIQEELIRMGRCERWCEHEIAAEAFRFTDARRRAPQASAVPSGRGRRQRRNALRRRRWKRRAVLRSRNHSRNQERHTQRTRADCRRPKSRSETQTPGPSRFHSGATLGADDQTRIDDSRFGDNRIVSRSLARSIRPSRRIAKKCCPTARKFSERSMKYDATHSVGDVSNEQDRKPEAPDANGPFHRRLWLFA